jgi:hypothetical protein
MTLSPGYGVAARGRGLPAMRDYQAPFYFDAEAVEGQNARAKPLSFGGSTARLDTHMDNDRASLTHVRGAAARPKIARRRAVSMFGVLSHT